MAMDLLGCYNIEKKQPPIKNCTEFVKHNYSDFQTCLSQYKVDVLDNYMIFFGQIEPICQYYNFSSPDLSAATILKVVI